MGANGNYSFNDSANQFNLGKSGYPVINIEPGFPNMIRVSFSNSYNKTNLINFDIFLKGPSAGRIASKFKSALQGR